MIARKWDRGGTSALKEILKLLMATALWKLLMATAQ